MTDDLDLRIARPLKAVTQQDLVDATSEAKAITDMIAKSGLQDKTIAIEINIEPAILSKSKSGQARLSEDHMDRLMDTAGSELWLFYWLQKRGYDPFSIRKRETELEQKLRHAEERIKELEDRHAVTIQVLRDVRAA